MVQPSYHGLGARREDRFFAPCWYCMQQQHAFEVITHARPGFLTIRHGIRQNFPSSQALWEVW